MPYKVIKNDEFIGTHGRVDVGYAGELTCRSEWGTRVEAIYAPGTWDHVVREEAPDAD